MTTTKISFRKTTPNINALTPSPSAIVIKSPNNITPGLPTLSNQSVKPFFKGDVKYASVPTPKIKISKDKKASKQEPEIEVHVKKRGRPSKEEVMLREKEKLERENQLKDRLIQAQADSDGHAVALSEVTSSVSTRSAASFAPKLIDFDMPIFKMGDYVEEVISIKGRRIFKGIVQRQDIDSPFVFVSWKDGSKQWHGAKALQKISEKEYRKRDEIVAEIEIDEKTLDGCGDINEF